MLRNARRSSRKMPTLLPNFNQNRNLSKANFGKPLQYQIQRKSVLQFPICFAFTDGWADGVIVMGSQQSYERA
jgi:hypothetical protein